MSDERRDRLDQLLELLTEEVADRLRGERSLGEEQAFAPQAPSRDVPRERSRAAGPMPATGAVVDEESVGAEADHVGPRTPEDTPSRDDADGPLEEGSDSDPRASERDAEPPAPPTSHTARFLGRLALGLLVLIVVINIPFNRHGTTLATAMPDRRALVIRDGLVVTEEDDPEIYVYQDGQFRWISSLKAFEMKGYTWRDVHVVEDGFLEPYEIGPPIHVIVKCHDSPHVYRIEEERKRWIVDIEAFEEAGYVWEDVEFVSCEYLRGMPDGETVPPGQGPPPQP
jgi:hypothetical protein